MIIQGKNSKQKKKEFKRNKSRAVGVGMQRDQDDEHGKYSMIMCARNEEDGLNKKMTMGKFYY